jgi:acyl transferase domain-containing protein
LRHTVRFADGMHRLLKEPNRVLLEVGPGRTLSSMLSHYPEKTPEHLALRSLRHPSERRSDAEVLWNSVGQLWLADIRIDWQSLHPAGDRRRLPLPTYPFERKRFWIDAPDRSGPIALPDEISRNNNGVGDSSRHLSADEKPPAKIANSEDAELPLAARLSQPAKQLPTVASSLLPPSVKLRNLSPLSFHELTIKEQIQIMAEQLALQGKVMIKQLDLFR